MISAIASFLNNFVSKNDPPMDMKDVDNLIANVRQENSVVLTKEDNYKNDEGCFYKSGIVTAMRDDFVLLDDKFVCDMEKVAIQIKVGDKVKYMAYQLDGNKEQKIHRILSVCDTSWDEEYQEFLPKSDEPIKGQMISRKIVGKVMKREGRSVHVEPHDIVFSLDNVRSEFIPLVGDWLSIDSLVEVREEAADLNGEVLEVERIRPLRSKLHIGSVTYYNLCKGVGNIDRNTIFTKTVCEPGYIPCVGDKVVTDSIESDQGAFAWRSLNLVPLQQVNCISIIVLSSTNIFIFQR